MKQPKFKLNERVYIFRDSNKTNLLVGRIVAISIVDNSKYISAYQKTKKSCYAYTLLGEGSITDFNNSIKIQVKENMVYKGLDSIYKRCKRNITENKKLDLGILNRRVKRIKKYLREEGK